MSIFEVREKPAFWRASTFSLDHSPFYLNIVLEEISTMYILSEYVRVRIGAQVCHKDQRLRTRPISFLQSKTRDILKADFWVGFLVGFFGFFRAFFT